MGNRILNYGVTTPFVLFNFATGSIESTIKPKYFVELNHNRTCKKATTFKLRIMYIPDTFSEGRPTLIDNLLISSRNDRVTYQYGYYDWRGARHVQDATYVGQMNKYDCDVDIASGTLTYTIEGCATAVELLNTQTSLDTRTRNYDLWRFPPSKVIRLCSDPDYPERPFYQLGLYYDRVIKETDEYVPLPLYTQQGMMDIILGTAKAAKDSVNAEKQTNIDRDGGIVQHSRSKTYETIYDAYKAGTITTEEFINIPTETYLNSNVLNGIRGIGSIVDEDKYLKYNSMAQSITNKLYSPFMAYFDDFASTSHKYGTFYYVPKEGNMASNSYVFEYGNNVRQSDVLSISFTYDGSVALANANGSQSLAASIDDEGTNIGQSQSTTNVLSLGRNSYPTLSGFKEDRFLSQRELQSYMIYPSKATMTIMGQLEHPNNLLDIIDVVVLINGTRHPTLSGEYSILSINDTVNSSGYTTTFELVRKEKLSDINLEIYVTNPSNGKASKNDERKNNTTSIEGSSNN